MLPSPLLMVAFGGVLEGGPATGGSAVTPDALCPPMSSWLDVCTNWPSREPLYFQEQAFGPGPQEPEKRNRFPRTFS